MNQEYKPQSIRESYSHLLSQDYDRLWDLICSGQEVAIIVESEGLISSEEREVSIRIASAKRTKGGLLSIGTPGISYSLGSETKENGRFQELCKFYNLAFLDTNTLKSEFCKRDRLPGEAPSPYVMHDQVKFIGIEECVDSSIVDPLVNHFKKRGKSFSVSQFMIANGHILLNFSYDKLIAHRLFLKWIIKNIYLPIGLFVQLTMEFPDGKRYRKSTKSIHSPWEIAEPLESMKRGEEWTQI